MSALPRQLAAHPIDELPYNKIQFIRVDGNGKPIYRVGSDPRECGAASALRTAFELFGGNCFHCGNPLPDKRLSPDCTRDHVRPKKDGGKSYLHNLVLACGACNRDKSASDLIRFRPDVGVEYLRALDEHLVKCLSLLHEASLRRG